MQRGDLLNFRFSRGSLHNYGSPPADSALGSCGARLPPALLSTETACLALCASRAASMALKMLLANALSGSCRCSRAAARISSHCAVGSKSASSTATSAALSLSTAFRQHSQRSVSSSAVVANALSDVLQKELEYEKSNYEPPAVRHLPFSCKSSANCPSCPLS